MNPPNGRKEIENMFGNPANTEGALNETWKSENIVMVAPPNGWRFYYQEDSIISSSSGILLHRLLKESFILVMTEIWDYAKQQIGASATDEEIRNWLHQKRLDLHGGGFNFRKQVDAEMLSLHAYGIAIDWDPYHNPRQKPLTKTLPDWWYKIWNNHGWSDGRHFQKPDPMHVQFATGA